MIGIVEDRRTEVAALCERYGVKRLDLFGSAAGDGFDPEASDLDFVVSFERRDPPELFDRYFGLKEDLESLFGEARPHILRILCHMLAEFSHHSHKFSLGIGPELGLCLPASAGHDIRCHKCFRDPVRAAVRA